MKKGEIMPDKQMDNTSETQAKNGEDAKQLSKQITQRIRKILRERNTTQKTLAKDIGVDTSQVSKWMNNENSISTLYLYKISKALNVSIDWLCGIEKKEDDNKSRINSMRDMLTSIWEQYLYCENGMEIIQCNIKNDPTSLDEELSNAIVFDYGLCGEINTFLESFKKFVALYKSNDINFDDLQTLIHGRIESISNEYEQAMNVTDDLPF